MRRANVPGQGAALASVLGAMALVVSSAGLVHVALPTLARAFEVTPAAAVRLVTTYQLGLVVALLPAAALGQSLGARPVFAAGVGVFVIGSALGALAPSLALFAAARFVQGVGGAAVMALGVALLREGLPESRVAPAIGWNALTVAAATGLAPTLGALWLTVASWRGLFALQVPLGLVVLLATRGLPSGAGHRGHLDRLGIALTATAFGALVTGAERLVSSPRLAAALLITGLFGAVILTRRESSKVAPLVPIDLLRGRGFRLSALASVACFAGQSAALVALPFHLGQGFGQDTLSIGLTMTPWPLLVGLTAPVSARLLDRVPGAWLCAAGGALLAVALGVLAAWPTHGDPRWLLPPIALAGVGFGLFQVPNNQSLLLSAPRARSAAAGGAQATARITGQTVGAIAMSLLFTLTPPELAPRLGLGLGAVLTLAAGAVSLSRSQSTLGSRDARMPS